MVHTIFGSAALLATLTILLRTWEVPRWAVRAFCVCAVLGGALFALSRPGPVGPRAVEPAPSRISAPGPAVEGTWDAREPRRIRSLR